MREESPEGSRQLECGGHVSGRIAYSGYCGLLECIFKSRRHRRTVEVLPSGSRARYVPQMLHLLDEVLRAEEAREAPGRVAIRDILKSHMGASCTKLMSDTFASFDDYDMLQEWGEHG